jgi:hypothetical protein
MKIPVLTGKLTGNFADSGICLQDWLPFNQRLQWLAVKFPTPKNREFFEAKKKLNREIREFDLSAEPPPNMERVHHLLTKSG